MCPLPSRPVTLSVQLQSTVHYISPSVQRTVFAFRLARPFSPLPLRAHWANGLHDSLAWDARVTRLTLWDLLK